MVFFVNAKSNQNGTLLRVDYAHQCILNAMILHVIVCTTNATSQAQFISEQPV